MSHATGFTLVICAITMLVQAMLGIPSPTIYYGCIAGMCLVFVYHIVEAWKEMDGGL